MATLHVVSQHSMDLHTFGHLPISYELVLVGLGWGQDLRFGLFRGKELRSLEDDLPPAHIQTTEEVDDDVLHLSSRQSLMKTIFDDDVNAVWKTPPNLFCIARWCITVHRTA